MDWMSDYNWFVTTVKARLAHEDVAGFPRRKCVQETADLDKYLNRVCTEYLSAPEKAREHIRVGFADPDALWFLCQYAAGAPWRMKTASPMTGIRLGLAAASIADQRPDPHDFVYVLGSIYRAAQQVGVADPMPVFREIAALSRQGVGSTGSLMSTFDRTAVCREMAEFPESIGEAVRLGNRFIIKKMLDMGMDVNQVDPGGLTPLMVASKKGDIEIIRLLLERGANVNALCPIGRSALVFAAEHGNRRAVEVLLAAGAKVDVMPQGLSLLDFLHDAPKSPRAHGIVELLRAAGAR